MRIHGLAAGLVWFAPLVASEPLRISSSCQAMGTVYSLVAYDHDRSLLQTAADLACAEAERIEAFLSHYRQDSELSRVNREAARGWVRVSPELFALLQACQHYSRASEGTFDITVGPLVKIWGFYKGTGRLPHRSEIRQALARVGFQKLELDPAQQAVRFKVPGMELDPGGIGKGYTVDRIVEVLRKLGVRSALISAGGSSIYALGTPPGEKGWKIQIRDPRSPARTVEEVVLRDESLSTSGSYEKFFVVAGKRYSHIFHPRTGYPAEGTLAVSVIAPRTLDSEAWTKPIYILGRQWAARHVPKGFRVFYCEDKVNVPCAWLQ